MNNSEAIIETVLRGNNIGCRDTGTSKVFLIAIDSFYVEVYYDQKTDEITKFFAFDDLSFLDIYLQLIDLAEINEIIETNAKNYRFEPFTAPLLKVFKKVDRYVKKTLRSLS